MTDESKALQPKEKKEVTTSTEQTRPGPVFIPVVDIFETEKELTLLADMPGVKAENLNIDINKGVLTLIGDVQPPEAKGETEVWREYRTGKYQREFHLSDIIDQAKIEAELKDGVLRLRLPKIEAAKPRKIAVKAS
ncbi:MAG: Hsp20/alpha crystallin family protein [Deltaproteobacteria bacterium]|nr:Hsp20/alpha crystallin family protein [Deltaproteobacteria bacterium]